MGLWLLVGWCLHWACGLVGNVDLAAWDFVFGGLTFPQVGCIEVRLVLYFLIVTEGFTRFREVNVPGRSDGKGDVCFPFRI